MSAEKAFLAAHYGGPFDFNKEDYIIVSITDTRYEADCPVVFRPVKNLKYVFRVPFIDIAASKLDPTKTVEEQTGLDLPVFSKKEALTIKAIGDFAKKYDYQIDVCIDNIVVLGKHVIANHDLIIVKIRKKVGYHLLLNKK